MVKQEEVLFDDFSKGMNTRVGIGAVGRNQFRFILNLEPQTMMGRGLTLGKVATTLFTLPTPSPGYTGLSLHRYDDGTTRRLLVHRSSNDIVAQDEASAWSPTVIGGSTDPNGARFVNTPGGDTIWTNGAGSLQVWGGSGSASDVGVQTPNLSGIVASTTGTGVVDVTGKTTPYYQFAVTYVNSRGVESAVSGVSNAAYPTLQQLVMTVSVATGGDIDAEVSTVRFYLIGGEIGILTYIGEVAATHPGGGGGTVATYTFNKYDADVGTKTINTDRIPMPDGLDVLCVRQNRLWAGKSGKNTIWFSGYDSYEMASQTSENDGFDGGSLELPGGSDDGLVALGHFATLLIIGRERSIYTLYGNQSSQFSNSKRLPVGATNRDSIAVGRKAYYIACTDHRVYRFLDGEGVPISDPIEDTLKAIPKAVWDKLKLVWCDDALILTFQGETHQYAYLLFEDSDGKPYGWFVDGGLGCRFIASLKKPLEKGDELVMIDETTGRLIQRARSQTSEREIVLTTGEFQLDAEGASPINMTEFQYVTAEGTITHPANSADRIVIRTIYDSNTVDHPVQSTGPVLFDFGVKSGEVGRWLALSIYGKIASGFITYLASQVRFYRGRIK